MAARITPFVVLPALAFCAGTLFVNRSTAQKPDKVDFVHDVQPIFQKSCVMCHGSQTQMAGLRLDAKQSVLAKVVVAGNSAASPLYQRVAGIGDVARMPMGGRLADDQIATVKRWIEEGAEWPDNIGAQVKAVKTHWAFVPPQRPALTPGGRRGLGKKPDRRFCARPAREGTFASLS